MVTEMMFRFILFGVLHFSTVPNPEQFPILHTHQVQSQSQLWQLIHYNIGYKWVSFQGVIIKKHYIIGKGPQLQWLFSFD